MQTEPDQTADTSSSSADQRPLDGIKVLELAQWVAGPSSAGLLGDWGADIIKVEAPRGDPQRSMYAAVGIDKPLPNPSFAQDNRGKRAIVVDLQTDEGKATFERLLAKTDIFITNLRLDALERLRLDPTSVRERHPHLVIASQTGYGPVGPAREIPGYDIGAFVSRTGLARTNSPVGQPPINLRGAIGDHMTGMTTAAGILAALHQRTATGDGVIVETSLFQTGLYSVSWDLSTQLTFGRLSRMRDRTIHDGPLVNSYRAADDRWFYLIGIEMARHFPGVCAAIEQPDLAEDERFKKASSMRANSPELIAILDAAFAAQPLDYWAERFEENDVWWAPCQTMAEVAEDPQAHALESFIVTEDNSFDGEETIRTIASPVRFDGKVFQPRRPVPSLGEHTDEVLAELDGE